MSHSSPTEDEPLPTRSVRASSTLTIDPLPALEHLRRPVDPAEQGRARSEMMARLFSPDEDQAAPTPRRYELGRVVGHGGCGVVYEAHDSQLARRVAVKLLHSQSNEGTERAARALLAEARAVASLTHPNIVAVYDAGTSLPGYEGEMRDAVYVVMELIEGQTLRQWGKTPRPWAQVVGLYMKAGRGLAAAHDRGLVHRDFKPGNVMIDHTGRVVVLDFGLATTGLPAEGSLESPPDADASLSVQATRTWGIVGTPAYMAPEQIAGHELDSRCDQFSFCMALYETLVGRRPFGDDRDRIAWVACDGPLAHPPPQLGALKGNAPPWLERVLRRGLRADPAARYPSMDAVVGALRRGLGQRRRRSLGAVLAAGLTAASVATYAATRASVDACASASEFQAELWDDKTRAAVRQALEAAAPPHTEQLWSNLSRDIDEYAVELSEARVEACQTSRVGDARASNAVACLDVASTQLLVVTELLGSSDAELVPRAADLVGELPPIGECRVGKNAGLAPRIADLEIERLLAKATVLLTAGRYDQILPFAQAALDQAIEQGDRSAEARALIILGHLDSGHKIKRIESAEQRFHAALVAAEAANDPRSELLALAGSIHAVGTAGARHAEADRLVEHAMGKLDGHSVGPYVEARVRRAIGTFRFTEHRYEDAMQEFERSDSLLQSLIGERSLERASLAIRMGEVAVQSRDVSRAKEHFERARELVLESAGPEHPRMSGALNGLGVVALQSNQPRRAQELFAEIIHRERRWYGPDHLSLAAALTNEANALEVLGEYDTALSRIDEALRIRRRYDGERHPAVAEILTNRAIIVESLGDVDEALSNYREAIEILEAAGPTMYLAMLPSYTNIALIHREQEQWDEAIATMRRAWELVEQSPQTPVRTMAVVEAELAMSLFYRDREQARVHIEHAHDQLAALGASPDLVPIRAYRDQILAADEPEPRR